MAILEQNQPRLIPTRAAVSGQSAGSCPYYRRADHPSDLAEVGRALTAMLLRSTEKTTDGRYIAARAIDGATTPVAVGHDSAPPRFEGRGVNREDYLTIRE